MKNLMTFFITVLFILHFMACKKPCHQPDYHFSINSSFAIEKDSMPVGDTLWLTCESSTNMLDLNTKSQIDFSNAQNFGSALIISDINKFHSLIRGAVDSFDFVKARGDIYTIQNLDPNGTKQLNFAEGNDMYSLKIGMVAKRKGLYILSIVDIPNVVYRKGQEQCGKGSFEILNNNLNRHFYLFENLWGPLSEYDKKHGYCVKVY
jgi:hypothetical protein